VTAATDTTPPAGPSPHDGCPKRMVYGPCGGVQPGGGCEVDGHRCPFLDDDLVVTWQGRPHDSRTVPIPRFVVDVRPTDDDAVLARSAVILGELDAIALLGEHLDDTHGRPQHELAAAVVDAGLPAIATLTGRGRDRETAVRDVDLLLAAGTAFVHCVTGDHPAARFGPDATAAFPLDGTQLTAIARDRGAQVSVAESPASPPVDRRAERLAVKQAAGADVAVLNHGGSPGRMRAFARAVRDRGVALPLVAPVPVVTDVASAHALEQFPGVELPSGLTRRIITAADPVRAGVAAAIDVGRELLDRDASAFAAVNLSGSATGDGPEARAEIMAEVAAGIG
jgi:methylenetetrahydrofolate reductase (NADPH)